MAIDVSNVDLDFIVLEMKLWPRSPRFIKAILGLEFGNIKTVKEITKIQSLIKAKEYPRLNHLGIPTPIDEKEQELLIISAAYRRMDLCQESIDKANSYKEAVDACYDAPEGTYVKENGWLKMLEFSDKDQTNVIFRSALYGSIARRKALEKLITFFPKKKSEENKTDV